MKRRIIILMSVACMALLASCSEKIVPEEQKETPEANALTISMTFDSSQTKTTLGGANNRTPIWESGDEIWISDGTKNTTYVLTSSDIDEINNVASFQVSGLSGETVYAVYPAVAAVGVSEGNVVITLVNQDGSFAKANICAAKADVVPVDANTKSATLAFKNATAILKFLNPNVDDITRVEPPKVTGLLSNCTVSWSGTAIDDVTPLSTIESITSSPSFQTDGYCYIAVAPITIPSGSTFYLKNSIDDYRSWMKTSSDRTVVVNMIYGMPDMSSAAEANLYKYSVSGSKYVCISQRNLQYDGDFGFMPKPYSTVEPFQKSVRPAANPNYGYPSNPEPVGLFGWGTSGFHNDEDVYNTNYLPYNTSNTTVDPDYNNFGYGPSITYLGVGESWNKNATVAQYDWGYQLPMPKTGTKWRTPTGGAAGEWMYLLSRTGKCGFACITNVTVDTDIASPVDGVEGLPGIIILPDSFTDPLKQGAYAKDSFEPYDVSTMGKGNVEKVINKYTSEDWDNYMSPAGAIFLPCAGGRVGSIIDCNAYMGYYWSSTAWTASNTKSAFIVYFIFNKTSSTNPKITVEDSSRNRGRSVRLVHDIN